MLIGAHQDEAVDTTFAQGVAQPQQPFGVVGLATDRPAQLCAALSQGKLQRRGQIGADQRQPGVRVVPSRRRLNSQQ